VWGSSINDLDLHSWILSSTHALPNSRPPLITLSSNITSSLSLYWSCTEVCSRNAHSCHSSHSIPIYHGHLKLTFSNLSSRHTIPRNGSYCHQLSWAPTPKRPGFPVPVLIVSEKCALATVTQPHVSLSLMLDYTSWLPSPYIGHVMIAKPAPKVVDTYIPHTHTHTHTPNNPAGLLVHLQRQYNPTGLPVLSQGCTYNPTGHPVLSQARSGIHTQSHRSLCAGI